MDKTRQYVGARYVPKFADPIAWNINRSYEALTIVTYLNNSYTSKKPVPANTDISNSEYWALTGNYNGQVESYRQETEAVKNEVDKLKENYLSGKKIWIYGDSMSDESASSSVQTMQPNWVSHFRDMLPADANIVNRSLAGRFVSGANGVANIMQQDANIDADIVIIFAGVNDFRHSRTLGTLSDADWSTFGGALKTISAQLQTKCPKANVFVISPLKNYETNYPSEHNVNMPCILYREMERAWASQNGYTYIDGYSAPMLNPTNGVMKSLYQKDGLHVNIAYTPLLAEFIYSHVVANDGTAVAKANIILDGASYVGDGVTPAYTQIIVDSEGEVTLNMSGTITVTENTNYDIFTFPAWFKPYTGVGVAARCQIGQTFSIQPVNVTVNKVVLRTNASGTCVFSFMYKYKPASLTPYLNASV